MGLQRLKTDEEFKHLIRPLLRKEYLQLEQNLLADGCRDPIVVWHDVIVDGHNRYEICMRHGIPFDTKDMEFECREAAIAWICANQLGRMHSAAPNGSWCGDQRQLSAANGTLN